MKNILSHLQVFWLMRHPPALFSRLFGLSWYRETFEQWIEPIQKTGSKILEVGCAGGDLSRLLAVRGMQVWAVDKSPVMLKEAQSATNAVHFKQADVSHLPFENQFFDSVLAASLLNVVNSPLEALTEMRRVCRPGGVISVLVPNQQFSDKDAMAYLEEKQLIGFSRAAFLTWHRLAKKMDAETVQRYFQNCGMEKTTTRFLLGGMVVVVSAQL